MSTEELHALAVWLHGAARESGTCDVIRQTITLAYSQANEMYGHTGELEMLEFEDDGPSDARPAISKFAELWDQCERDYRADGL